MIIVVGTSLVDFLLVSVIIDSRFIRRSSRIYEWLCQLGFYVRLGSFLQSKSPLGLITSQGSDLAELLRLQTVTL